MDEMRKNNEEIKANNKLINQKLFSDLDQGIQVLNNHVQPL